MFKYLVPRNLFLAFVFSLALSFSPAGTAGADETASGEKMDFVAVAYTSPDFQGVAWQIPEPGEYNLWEGFGLPNDSICSIAVAPGYRVTLYEHSNFDGVAVAIADSTPGKNDLRDRKRWASSLKVEKIGETDNALYSEWFKSQQENMEAPNKIEIDPENSVVSIALQMHQIYIKTFREAGEPLWYGTSTDEQRIEWGGILLKIFSDCGVDVREWKPDTFAQQMNNFYDWRKDLCVLDTACLILNVDPAPFKAEKTEAEKTEAEAAKDFIRQLQTLVAEDKRRELAGLVDYPLTVNGNPGMSIENADAFVKNYEAVFTKDVQECLREHDLNEDVFVRNMTDYMVGWGCIWFFQDDKGNMVLNVINPSEE